MSDVIPISSAGEVIAAIPALLRFAPSGSAVFLVLGTDGRRVRSAIRLDLPGPDDPIPGADDFRAILSRGPAGGIVTVIVDSATAHSGSQGSTASSLPHRAFVAELRRCADSLGLPAHVFWVDRIERGRPWRCYDDPLCTGTVPDPSSSPVAVDAVTAGAVLYANRDEFAAQITPAPQRDLDRRAAWLRRQPPMSADDATAVVTTAVLGAAHQLNAEPSAESVDDRLGNKADMSCDEDTLMRLAQALTVRVARDAALALALTENAEAAERLWSVLTRATPRPYVTHPATLLSVSALLRGNGALAAIALDTALTADPDNRLARGLRIATAYGISPDTIRHLLTESTAFTPIDT